MGTNRKQTKGGQPPVYLQGNDDYCCGYYCMRMAAEYFQPVVFPEWFEGTDRFYKHYSPGPGDFAKEMATWGLQLTEIPLADATDVPKWRERFSEGALAILWIGPQAEYPAGHYVLAHAISEFSLAHIPGLPKWSWAANCNAGPVFGLNDPAYGRRGLASQTFFDWWGTDPTRSARPVAWLVTGWKRPA